MAYESGGGYDWSEAALMRRDGQLYYVSDSGCSCNSFGDRLDESDLVPVANWQEAVELVKRDLGDVEAANFAEQMLKLRPEPSQAEYAGRHRA